MRRLWMMGLALAASLAACGGPRIAESPNVAHHNTDPSEPGTYHAFLLAERAALVGDWETAIAHYEHAASTDPTSGRIHQRLAEAWLGAGDPAAALRTLDIAIALDGPTDTLVILQAEAHEQDGRADDALAVFRQRAFATRSADYFMAWAAAAARADAPDALAEAASAFVDAHPDDPVGWHYLGEAWIADGELARAADAYRQAADVPGGSANDALRAIDALNEQGDAATALEVAQWCTDRFAEAVACYTERLLLIDAEDPFPSTPATEALDTLAGVSSRSIREMQIAGRTLGERGRPELVSALLASVTDARPFNTGILEGAAWVAYSLDDRHLAIAYMQRSLDLDPTNVNALNFIGYAWAELDENLDQAEVYVREALGIRPDDPNIMDSLAWVYFRMERFEEALEVQLAAVAGDDANPVLLDHLGDIYLALGRADDAREAWRRALEVVGGDDALRQELETKLAS